MISLSKGAGSRPGALKDPSPPPPVWSIMIFSCKEDPHPSLPFSLFSFCPLVLLVDLKIQEAHPNLPFWRHFPPQAFGGGFKEAEKSLSQEEKLTTLI